MGNKKASNQNFKEQFRLFYRALSFAFPFRIAVIGIVAITLFLSALYVLEPVIIGRIIDSFNSDNIKHELIKGIISLSILGVVKEVAVYFNNRIIWNTRIRLHEALLSNTVERIYNFPLHMYRKEGVGATMNRLEKGINGFVGAVSELITNLLPSLVYLVMALVVMFQLNVKMTLLVLVFAPIPALLALYAAPVQKKRERHLLDMWSGINSRMNEVLSGIVTVRSFVMENEEKRKFIGRVSSTNTRVLKGVKFDSGIGALQTLSVTVAKISAIGFGGYLVMNDQLSIGSLVAFLGFIGGLFGPIHGLTGTYKILQTASVNLNHIFNILDMEDNMRDQPNAAEAKFLRGEVIFNNVYFAYSNDGPEILKGLNLNIKTGETVAIVGPSGAGKSTIIGLLQRFIDPQQGNILIDGTDVKNMKSQSLRKQIGIVLQDVVLFNESIYNNILYGRPDATREEVENAAKAANIHERVQQFEKGYNTLAGERGNKLSLGERQRLSIARAILKDAPILILDEATSALDTELESKVQGALNNLVKGRTTLIIAHRLSTVVNADRILVLKEGKIFESGTHAELILQRGYYHSLVEKQIEGLLLPDLPGHLRSA
jgi:ATP-binding cassette, subfamily B, bacterial